MNFLPGIVEGLTNSILGALRFRGGQQRVRKFIRQYIIAPNLHRLHEPEIALKCAEKIMVACYGSNDASLLSAIAWNLLQATLFKEKTQLLADTILLHASNMQKYCKVVEDGDDLVHKFTEGRSDMEDFIVMLLSTIGG